MVFSLFFLKFFDIIFVQTRVLKNTLQNEREDIMPTKKDLIGQRFGKITVIKETSQRKNKSIV